MDTPFFPATDRLATLVDHLNSFSSEYFSAALARILESCKDETRPFTDSEFDQLVSLTGLAPLALAEVIEGCTYLFERSAAVGLKPVQVHAALVAQGVKEYPAEQISRTWAGNTESLASRRAAPFGSPASLTGSSYSLVVAAGSSAEAGIKTSRAIIDLQIAHGSASEGTQDNLRLELDKPQLLSLLASLDKMQQQIDSLS
jgi:hypothetical protein